jgi:N-acylneuraminate cytidylyltransferase
VNVAIITARGGSKRIPRKNLREFCGRPILQYVIDAARGAGCFDEVMVSTDDAEIAALATATGAAVPFLRSPDAASDTATTAAAVGEVLQNYRARGASFEYACCLYPTAPFVTPDALRAGLALLQSDSSTPGVLPVVRFSFPIERALRLTEQQRVSWREPQYRRTRSQDLEPAYHDAGQFYWLRVRAFDERPEVVVDGMRAMVVPEWQVQDIDSEDDWIMAEMKYRYLQSRTA